ncbi:EcsC family protein [Acinetobacter sp. XS-4]|uniref:EcsC family protein n=1 Tax=Acinetobacter sp. XS-4 TaxID=2923375 RepID=UPI0025AD28EC|nr:EcsC family protein [Acinetobacter sp. XS-4]
MEHMVNNLTENKIMEVLNWSYDKAVNGVVGLDSAYDLAKDYKKTDDSLYNQVNSLIRWQNTKAGTSGFITGLGGIITLPVAIPANVASVMYVQIRMIAAIAHMGGHNLNDDRVRSLVFVCLTGNAAKDILKDVGIVVGKKLAENAIKNISGKTITAINKKVGFRLLTKFGEKGAINLGKTIPLFGGIVGATFDSITTNTIGNIARDTFITI